MDFAPGRNLQAITSLTFLYWFIEIFPVHFTYRYRFIADKYPLTFNAVNFGYCHNVGFMTTYKSFVEHKAQFLHAVAGQYFLCFAHDTLEIAHAFDIGKSTDSIRF